MIKINQPFDNLMRPIKALVIYKSHAEKNMYIEAYDIDDRGRPINAHPLSQKESISLANGLADSKERNSAYLQAEGLLPENLLFLQGGMEGYTVWYTPRQQVELKFVTGLGIPCGKAEIPALMWKANRKVLKIYAIKSGKGKRPGETQILYHAPFFNIYADGRVCMGTVEIDIPENCRLEKFIAHWEAYFFNSYFSHCMEGHQPVSGNIVELWKNQTSSKTAFPENVLLKTKFTLNDLLP